MFYTIRAFAAGGAGKRGGTPTSTTQTTLATSRGRTGGASNVIRGRTGGSSKSNDFDYTSGKVQYTTRGFPIQARQTRDGYSYTMNGTTLRTSKKMSMSKVDDFFYKRDMATDGRFI